MNYIWHCILEILSIQEDKLFLCADQWDKGRRGIMGGIDKERAKKELKKVTREERYEELKEKEIKSA